MHPLSTSLKAFFLRIGFIMKNIKEKRPNVWVGLNWTSVSLKNSTNKYCTWEGTMEIQ